VEDKHCIHSSLAVIFLCIVHQASVVLGDDVNADTDVEEDTAADDAELSVGDTARKRSCSNKHV